MNKIELIDALAELITDNSDIGAEGEDGVVFEGVEEVMSNYSAQDADISVVFTDGNSFRISVEQLDFKDA